MKRWNGLMRMLNFSSGFKHCDGIVVMPWGRIQDASTSVLDIWGLKPRGLNSATKRKPPTLLSSCNVGKSTIFWAHTESSAFFKVMECLEALNFEYPGWVLYVTSREVICEQKNKAETLSKYNT